MLASEVHPAQVAGMFYPAEPESLNALIADMRKRARPDSRDHNVCHTAAADTQVRRRFSW